MNPRVSIDISGLDKADVLVALYNKSHVQGLGVLQALKGPFTKEMARDCLEESKYFDYLYGRVLKVDLSGDAFCPLLFDRDNYNGAAKDAIDSLRKQ